MNAETEALLIAIASYALWSLVIVVACLLLYLVIRQGVFHGLRAHTRWIDEGKH